MNESQEIQPTPEAAKVALPRLVRPLPTSGEADCPKCHSHGSVARHNADWTCHRCGFHEVVDDDRESERTNDPSSASRRAERTHDEHE